MPFRSRRDLRLAVAARAISLFGDEVATFALVLRLKEHGGAAVAIVLMANLVPIVLLGGLAGRLADRVDNRRLLAWAGGAQAVVCCGLVAASSPAVLLALIAVLGVGQAVTLATWQALLPSLVAPDDVVRALGLAQVAATVAGIAAPGAAGLLCGAFGTRIPLVVDGVSFVATAVIALLLHGGRELRGAGHRGVGHPTDDDGVVALPAETGLEADAGLEADTGLDAEAGAGPAHDARYGGGGLAIVRRDPLLRAVVMLLGAFVALGSMVNVVEVFLVRDVLHASVLWYGLNGVAFAGGMLGGALLGSRLSDHRRGFVLSAVSLATGLVLMGLAPGIGWLLAAGVATGVANGVLNVSTSALVVAAVPEQARGRVAGVLSAVVAGAQLAAYAGGGALATVLDPRAVFVAGGAAGLLAPLLLGRAVLRTSLADARAASRAGVAPACRPAADAPSPTDRAVHRVVPVGPRIRQSHRRAQLHR